MISRLLPGLTLALLGAGIVMGASGLLSGNNDTMRRGIFLTLIGMPPLIAHTVHNAHRVTAEQLAEADNAGYRRALDHVARGLLDQHAAPPNGGHPTETEQATGNVITLRPNANDRPERKAQ
ncbi:hypothetical protein OIU91_21180 [Streptomyces sp. NBC_01456]|uniref:hypothetical protein n=1 Tax=unclassified Streptomyces TaxID=2593676 RepID=UPI002E37386C|nr:MULTISPECIES: hypothetical protein [unclassified Streptomyces]